MVRHAIVGVSAVGVRDNAGDGSVDPREWLARCPR
jgi:hypothetical protein